jgi:hypothetical protein
MNLRGAPTRNNAKINKVKAIPRGKVSAPKVKSQKVNRVSPRLDLQRDTPARQRRPINAEDNVRLPSRSLISPSSRDS